MRLTDKYAWHGADEDCPQCGFSAAVRYAKTNGHETVECGLCGLRVQQAGADAPLKTLPGAGLYHLDFHSPQARFGGRTQVTLPITDLAKLEAALPTLAANPKLRRAWYTACDVDGVWRKRFIVGEPYRHPPEALSSKG